MIEIYHNPRCSKSRQTLALLEERKLDFSTRLYLKEPPSVAELDALLKALELEPTDILRFKEERAKELNLKANDARSRQEWLELLSQNPILIERPIVLADGKAKLGRPPEQVLEILD